MSQKKLTSSGMGNKSLEDLKKIGKEEERDPEEKPTKEERIQENAIKAVYRADLLIFAPDNINGAIINNIKLRNREEYDNVNHAIRDGKPFAVIQHDEGEYGRINFEYPVIYATATKIEPKKESKIVIAGGDSSILKNIDPNKLRQ